MLSFKQLLLRGGKVVTGSRVIQQGFILIGNGVIQAVGDIKALDFTTENCLVIEVEQDSMVFPGFIDPHTHGANGADVMDSTYGALQTISKALVQEGTTGFLATTMTENYVSLADAVKNAASFMNNNGQGAELIGLHLEGPFISPKQTGAQAKENILEPSIEKFVELQSFAKDSIRMVTLAPEETNGLKLVNFLKDRGVIPAIGHSDARYEVVSQAVKSGLTHATHLYNAMRPLHHREPGVVGGVFLHSQLSAELILDGIHVAEEMARLAYQIKGPKRIQLVTDAMRAKGLEEGEYSLGGQWVVVQKGTARLADGKLAGSLLKMNDAVKRAYKYLTKDLCDLAYLSSTNAAEEIGVADRKGRIEVGKDADLVVLNHDFEVLMTFGKGRVLYLKPA